MRCPDGVVRWLVFHGFCCWTPIVLLQLLAEQLSSMLLNVDVLVQRVRTRGPEELVGGKQRSGSTVRNPRTNPIGRSPIRS